MASGTASSTVFEQLTAQKLCRGYRPLIKEKSLFSCACTQRARLPPRPSPPRPSLATSLDAVVQDRDPNPGARPPPHFLPHAGLLGAAAGFGAGFPNSGASSSSTSP